MKTRIFFVLMLIVLFTIFVTQNTQIVTINVFFWQFTSPQITIFVFTGVAGVIFGLILATFFHSAKKKKLPDQHPVSDIDKNEI